MSYNPETLHITQGKQVKPSLAYEPGAGFFAQQRAIGEKLEELLCVPACTTKAQPLIEYKKDMGDYEDIRFRFESEPDFFVPCHLLLPKQRQEKLPVLICLQGHSTGMYLSLGEKRLKKDARLIAEMDKDYAVQAVKQGFAAIALEQRGFGEQNANEDHENTNCTDMAMQALLLGRTLLGERCHDVSALIDLLPAFPELDCDKIGLMGQSGGGTVTIYAAAMDKRIKIAMPSCSFCTYYGSILSIHHCSCNYIPHIYQYMDMSDITVLIAPRPIVFVAGESDRIFPIAEVQKAYGRVKSIYDDAGVPENCSLVVGDGGHRFYGAKAWPIFKEYFHSL